MKPMATEFSKLPKDIRRRLKDMFPEDYLSIVNELIPALGGKTIAELSREQEGLRIVRGYLSKIEGYLGK